MAITVGTYSNGYGLAANWSVVTNPNFVYYVSDTDGVDTNTGLTPTPGANGPVKTLVKGYQKLLANNSSSTAQWMLLKRGDSFIDQDLSQWPVDQTGNWQVSGNVAGQNPTVVSNYDPAIAVNTSTGAGVNPASSILDRPLISPVAYRDGASIFTDYLAFMGLHFKFKRGDPDDALFSVSIDRLSIDGGGTGYHVNDVITCNSNDGTTLSNAIIVVTQIDGGGAGPGVITGAFAYPGGSAPSPVGGGGAFLPTNPPTGFTQASVSPAGGSGATFSANRYAYGNGVGLFNLSSTINFWLVEDCNFEFMNSGCNYGGGSNFSGIGGNSQKNITWRKNQYNTCYSADPPHSAGVHGGGAYPWQMEELIVYHGGWGPNGIPFAPTQPDSFNHNWYTDFGNKGDINTYAGPPSFWGNLSSQLAGSGQMRAGGVVRNCSWLDEGFAHTFVSNFPNASNEISSCVYSETRNLGEGALGFGAGSVDQSIMLSASATNPVFNNLFVNSIDSSVSGVGTFSDLSSGFNIHDNIVYNFGPSNITPTTCFQPNNGGAVTFGTITGGSGYTSQNTAISNITRSTDADTLGMIVLTVTSSGTPLGQVVSGICCENITGTIGADLNGIVFTCAPCNVNGNFFAPDGTHLVLLASAQVGLSHSYTGGGDAVIPYYQVPLVTNTGVGSGASTDIYVGTSGAVIAVDGRCYESQAQFGAPPPSNGSYGNAGGTSYAIGNEVKVNDATQLGGGGAGFKCQVAAITSNTVGSNTLDPAASNPGAFPHPTRSSASYYTLIGLPGGYPATRLGFIQAMLHAQAKNTWNPLLTPASYNDYMRQGFGMTMLGSAFADTQGGGVTSSGATVTQTQGYGVYKSRPVKMPHA